jgi:hypothetical protein
VIVIFSLATGQEKRRPPQNVQFCRNNPTQNKRGYSPNSPTLSQQPKTKQRGYSPNNHRTRFVKIVEVLVVNSQI